VQLLDNGPTGSVTVAIEGSLQVADDPTVRRSVG
jgi:hypothetical protein